MRPIDADAIPYKRDIVVTERFSKFGAFNGKIVYSVTKEEIDAMPTVEAVPVKHGRWTMAEGELAFWDVCSECGKKILHRTPYYDFCPNCGARMDGKDGEGRE